MLEKGKYIEIRYNTDNIQILCITNVSYSTIMFKKTHVRLDRSDRKIKLELLLKMCPIPAINKWFSLHTKE